MKFTDEEGKVWDCIATGELIGGIDRCWVHLQPVPTIHEFGGVRFEETGEERCAKPGEWCLLPDERMANPFDWMYPMHRAEKATTSYPIIGRILRPLQGE